MTSTANKIVHTLLAVMLCLGCSNANDGMANNLDLLTSATEEIINAFETGEPESAHNNLHNVDFLITQIAQKAKSQELSSEKESEIKQHAEALLDEFQVLDSYLHGTEVPEDYDFAPVATKLRESLAKLKEALGMEVAS